MDIQMPMYVEDVLHLIKKEGGNPYVVGGAVRDVLMEKTPHDWDVASDLTPDELIAVFHKHNIPIVEKLGNNFGVVVGVFGGNPVEIATFRSESYGNDPHRPEKIVFCKSIDDDLARRDFTMNAMAMDIDGNIIDPFNGQNDIKRKYIRPVGDTEKRYKEDPLRMYRACRFVSQLGFSYTENVGNTPCIVGKDFWKETNASELSVERVRNEMEKLLLGKHPDKGLQLWMDSGLTECPCLTTNNKNKEHIYPFACLTHLKDLPQNPEHHNYDAWNHTIVAVRNVPQDLALRYTMLFHDAGKGTEGVRGEKNGNFTDYGHEKVSAKIVEKSLRELGYNTLFINRVHELVDSHMSGFSLDGGNINQMKRWLKRKSQSCRSTKELVNKLGDLENVFVADIIASKNDTERVESMKTVMKILHNMAEHFPVHSNDLNIRGNKVKEIIGDTMDIKTAYETLITKVQNEVVLNNEEDLIRSLEKQIARKKKDKKKEILYSK